MRNWLLRTFLFLVVAASTLAVLPPAEVAAAFPNAPTQLTGITVSGGQVNLHWTDTATTEAGFRIERAPDIGGLGPGTFAAIGTAAANAVTYSDMTVIPKTAYWYRVVATGTPPDADSFPSNEVRILTVASMPAVGLTAPAGTPRLIQGGAGNAVTATVTSPGTTIPAGGVEYQFVADNPPGVFDAKDIVSTQMNAAVGTPLAASPVANTMAMPASLPAGCVAEFEIRGFVASIGANGVYTIGTLNPFIVYQSATTKFIGARMPIVGDVVKVIAYRNATANGPLVAYSIRYWAPGAPTPPANTAPSLILSFLLDGNVTAMTPPVMAPGYSATGEIWTIGTGKFRIDYPDFPAYIDANVAMGTGVTVRFAAKRAEANVARQIFKQTTASINTTTDVNPVFDYTPVPAGLPSGTWLYFIVDGVVKDINLLTGAWTIGEENVMVYQTAATLLAPATVGDEVLCYCRRTLTPGPLVMEQLHNILPGPLTRPYKGTAIEVHLMYNGTIATMGPNVWTVNGPAGTPVSFVVDDPEGVARIDPMPYPAFAAGDVVTVEFDHVGGLLPDNANWAPMTRSGTTNNWSGTLTAPAVPADQTGMLFVRGIDALQQSATVTFSAVLNAPLVAPGAPTGASAVQTGTGQVTLTWTPGVTGDPAVDFIIERAIGAGAFSQLAIDTASPYVDSTVAVGSTYSYRVVARNTAGNSPASNTSSVTVSNAPAAPTSLNVALLTTTSVQVTWKDNAGNETGYRVFSDAATPGTFVQIGANLPANTTTFTNTITAGATHSYRVVAFTTGLPDSAPATAAISNAAPTNPGGVTITLGSLIITWTDMSTNEVGFRIERATAAAGPWTILDTDPVTAGVQDLPANSTTFEDMTAVQGTTYYFRVTALGGAATGGNSTPVTPAGGSGVLYDVPAAPTGLSVYAPAYNRVTVTWADAATNESGYKVQRSTNNFATVTTDLTPTALAANSTTFTDNTPTGSTTYQYRVFAINSLGNSANLGPMSVTTPAQPSGGGGGGGGGASFGSNLIGVGLVGTNPSMDGNGKSLTAGQMATADGKCALTIPVGVSIWNAAGAAQGFLSAATPATVPAVGANEKLIASYEMGPNGVTFNPVVTMTMSYTDGQLTGVAENSLYIGWWDGTKWVKLTSAVNAAGNTVSAPISHFTTFALIGQAAQPTTTPPTTTPPTTTPPTTTPPTTSPPTTTPPTTAPPTTTYHPPTTTASPAGDGANWLLIGGIVAAIIIIGIIIFTASRPKKTM